MSWISFNLNFSYWQLSIFFVIIIIFFSFILFIILSYFFFKWLHFNVSSNYFKINDFSKHQKYILKKIWEL